MSEKNLTIGARIKLKREEMHISQLELAKKVGFNDRSSIAKIELDARSLNQSKIKLIADALNTTPAYIMGWDENDKAVERSVELSEIELKLLQYYRSLDQSGKDFVNSVMDREYDRCIQRGKE